MAEEPQDWEVMKVVDKRNNPVTGHVEYLLQWKNWKGPPTWEPKVNCDCAALIRKFEKARSNKNFPRAKSPEPQDCCDSSCSEAGTIIEDPEELNWDQDIRKRRLLLKEIVGAIKGDEILLVVKWHGIAKLEKVPLEILRRYYSQDILDFLLDKINWKTPS